MARTAVVHPLNEQPFLVDLVEEPSPGDLNLVCTNARSLDGRRLVFIDDPQATFLFPYIQIRFVEIRVEGATAPGSASGEERRQPGEAPAADEDLEIDEDFLRRIREA